MSAQVSELVICHTLRSVAGIPSAASKTAQEKACVELVLQQKDMCEKTYNTPPSSRSLHDSMYF